MNTKEPGHEQGLALNRAFFFEAVEPILNQKYPDLRYAAALIGVGSEVLGYDDATSPDHHWGPRALLFLPSDVHENHYQDVWDLLAEELPYTFQGLATHFNPPDRETGASWQREEIQSGPVNHLVEVHSLEGYCQNYLGIKPDDALTPEVWLTIPGQKLRTFTGGEVFKDDLGDLTVLRNKLAYYPDQVWMYLLAAAWARIGNEEHFLGRTGYRDDDLGSRLIAARLVHDLMNLCFLIERVYPPYSKWFGTAFKELKCAKQLMPMFLDVLSGENWQERENAIIPAYEYVADAFNQLGLVEPLPAKVSQFHNRPFKVIWADHRVSQLYEKIQDPAIKAIKEKTLVGSVEQFSTSTSLLDNSALCVKVREIYSY